MTIVQTFLYFRLYPKDQPRIKLMVRVSDTDLPPPSLKCVFPAGRWHPVRTTLSIGVRNLTNTVIVQVPRHHTYCAHLRLHMGLFRSELR